MYENANSKIPQNHHVKIVSGKSGVKICIASSKPSAVISKMPKVITQQSPSGKIYHFLSVGTKYLVNSIKITAKTIIVWCKSPLIVGE